MKKIDLGYLLKKTWFLIIFAGGLGYYTIDMIYRTYSYEPSQFIGSGLLPAAIMYGGLIAGFNLGSQKRK